MIDSESEPVVLLAEIKEMLREVGELGWYEALSKLESSILGEDESVAARKIVKLYRGGMCSFNDLVLHENRIVRRDLMWRFSQLRCDLSQWARINI